MNISGKIGKAALDSKPEVELLESLTLDRVGEDPVNAGFCLMINTKHEREILKSCQIDNYGQLIDKNTDEPYMGDYPYVVISLDGRQRDEYKGFTPTAATADILGGFYGGGDPAKESVAAVVSAMKLYNDWDFRKEALRLEEQIKSLDKNSSDYAQKLQELTTIKDALIKNILNDEFKPKDKA